jgi:hypothetical protein
VPENELEQSVPLQQLPPKSPHDAPTQAGVVWHCPWVQLRPPQHCELDEQLPPFPRHDWQVPPEQRSPEQQSAPVEQVAPVE